MRHSCLSLLVILLLAIASSCSTSKKALRPDASAMASWQDLYVPVNVTIHSPRYFSTGSVTMYMIKDREITFSMHFLGMTVGAIHITPDSLMAYSMPQRVYVAEDLASALGGVTLPLGDIQALLLGEAFPAFDKLPALSKDNFTIGTREDPSTGSPESLSVTQTNPARTLLLSWMREAEQASMPFARSVNLNLEGATASPFSATITYNWEKAQINPLSPREFKLPSSYKRIAGRNLLKALTAD